MKRLMTVVTVVFVMIASTMTTMAAPISYSTREEQIEMAYICQSVKRTLDEFSEEYGATWDDLRVWIADYDENGDPIFVTSFKFKGEYGREHRFTVLSTSFDYVYIDGIAVEGEKGEEYVYYMLTGDLF